MSWMAPAAIVYSAWSSSNAAGSAADAQIAASQYAADVQREIFNKQTELQKPWRETGERALAKLEAASDYTPFTMNQFNADPGYGFRLSEGQKALERSAAARGGLLSGATGKALTRFGQEMGSQEYQNAFNRYQAERAAKLQPLQSLAGVGQTAANALTNAAGSYGSNLGELAIGAGNARASAYVGQANALNQGLGMYLNYRQGQNMINAINPNRGGATGQFESDINTSGF